METKEGRGSSVPVTAICFNVAHFWAPVPWEWTHFKPSPAFSASFPGRGFQRTFWGGSCLSPSPPPASSSSSPPPTSSPANLQQCRIATFQPAEGSDRQDSVYSANLCMYLNLERCSSEDYDRVKEVTRVTKVTELTGVLWEGWHVWRRLKKRMKSNLPLERRRQRFATSANVWPKKLRPQRTKKKEI